MRCLVISVWLVAASSASAAVFDITDFGAAANDKTDDTLAIRKALQACEDAGGGRVYVPAGTYFVSRQGAESPILELPSESTIHGDGAASILKFDPKVNQSNFWRMLGASKIDCQNVTIRDLHLDGSNTFRQYEPGKTPEQNHGIFFYRQEGMVENITIRDCLIENFSGDGIGLGPGCRNITIRDVSLRNFVRQGIQMAGGNGARDYLVSGCQDLEGEVQPGGSTIHVEHARGLKNVLITDNRCRHSILASGVDGISITDNLVTGRIVANQNTNVLVKSNIVRGIDKPRYAIQLGFANGLILKDNIISGTHPEGGGVYVWGKSRYNPHPSRDVLITENVIRVKGRGVFLNGVENGRVQSNLIQVGENAQKVVLQRTKDVQVDSGR